MELSPSSLDSVKTALIEEGFADLSDAQMGEHVRIFEEKGFPFYSEDGMDFLTEHVLGNSVSRIE